LAPALVPITVIRPPVASAVSSARVDRADQLEDHIERSVLGEAIGLDHLGAELGNLVAQVGVANRRGHAGADGPTELDRGGATPPAPPERADARRRAIRPV